MSSDADRQSMVEHQLVARGIRSPLVLKAFQTVPREAFLPSRLAEFAYRDTPLPIAEGQTISQPFIVALTLEALRIQKGDRVLEIGTGSGYAAALLGELANEVHTVERLPSLAESAARVLAQLGYTQVNVHAGDGTLGWPARAPYDCIAVAAGGPEIPKALLQQLAPHGRLVIPIGKQLDSQVLTRVTRLGQNQFQEEALCDVRFVPLIGERGWPDQGETVVPFKPVRRSPSIARLVKESAHSFGDIEDVALDALIERMQGARVVLLGEASHGTSEFYRMRARISKALIERAHFDFVAVEADWPDAARIDNYVTGVPLRSPVSFTPFSRFPTWMWRNREVHSFVEWLRAYNAHSRAKTSSRSTGFHGLDLYSLFTSLSVVLHYLDDVDPKAALVARARYGLLTPWQKDPAAYGRAVLAGQYESAERAVVEILKDMLSRRLDYALKDGARFFDAAQNARVVANAEHYYRAMYYSSVASWNQRDTHMFDTLNALFNFYGTNSRGIVWAHNSHVGNASATEMGQRGEHNIGQLSRTPFGNQAYIVGFGTDHGTVAAASNWDEPMQHMRVRPAQTGSYERLFHEVGVSRFMLHLRPKQNSALRDELMAPQLERAIGVIYRPETELQSHYFSAILPRQFDEYIWFDETAAVHPLPSPESVGTSPPQTYPFGL
jgi:protein-L-isoaspartate(D-aspartate) O-methyltransferase